MPRTNERSNDNEIAGWMVLDGTTGNAVGWYESEDEARSVAESDPDLVFYGHSESGEIVRVGE